MTVNFQDIAGSCTLSYLWLDLGETVPVLHPARNIGHG